MDPIASFKEEREKTRAAKVVRYLDYVEPRLGKTVSEWSISNFEGAEKRLEAWDQYWEIVQLHSRCFVNSWNWYSPEGEWGSAEQQTEEEAEQGKDNLLDYLLTFEKRLPLGFAYLLMDAPQVLMDIRRQDTGVFKDHYAAARKHDPEAFVRWRARWKKNDLED